MKDALIYFMGGIILCLSLMMWLLDKRMTSLSKERPNSVIVQLKPAKETVKKTRTELPQPDGSKKIEEVEERTSEGLDQVGLEAMLGTLKTAGIRPEMKGGISQGEIELSLNSQIKKESDTFFGIPRYAWLHVYLDHQIPGTEMNLGLGLDWWFLSTGIRNPWPNKTGWVFDPFGYLKITTPLSFRIF